MRLTLLRHGEPAWVDDHGLWVGDPGLSLRGREQAERVARRLAEDPPDALWVSPARRACETVAPLETALGQHAEVLPWLAEVDTRALGGRPAAKLQELFSERRRAPESVWWAGLPGCEPVSAFTDRVVQGIERELTTLGAVLEGPARWSQLPDVHVLAVCHGGTAAVLIASLLGLPPSPWPWVRMELALAGVAELRAADVGGTSILTLTGFNARRVGAESVRTAGHRADTATGRNGSHRGSGR